MQERSGAVTVDLLSADGKEVHSVDLAASASATDASAKLIDKLARKQARAVKPGSFMHLLMSSHHTTDGSPFTDTEIIAQAFIFLLAGPVFLTCMQPHNTHVGYRCSGCCNADSLLVHFL